MRKEGEHRSLWALADDNRQPIIEFLDRHPLLEGSQILSDRYSRE
jgi:hypothetical protein